MIFKVHESYQKTGNRIYQIKSKVYLNPRKCQTTPNQPINQLSNHHRNPKSRILNAFKNVDTEEFVA